jgi:DNA polymerase-1
MPAKKTAQSDNKPVVIVDGSSYLFRAYHALPELTNANGQSTGAIYGIVNMFKRLMADYADHNIVMVFDAKGKTTRHTYYPDYKANRPAMPEDLASQMPYIYDFIKHLGFPFIMESGIEADDIIGTLAKRYADKGQDVLISTGDKDMAQLVTDQIHLVNTMTDSYLDPAGVAEKFNVTPDKIIDYLALMGDKVDNIPGIPKCGPKTAAKWLNEYGSIENLLTHQDDIKGKIGENLREHAQQLPMSKRLATIDCDLDLALDLDSLQLREPNNEALTALYKELHFNRWYKALAKDDQPKITLQTNHTTPITDVATPEAWNEACKQLKEANEIAVVLEGSNEDPLKSELASIAFTDNKATYVCTFTSNDLLSEGKLTFAGIKQDLNTLFKASGKMFFTHDMKHVIKICHHLDMTAPKILFDTMLAAYVLSQLTGKQDLASCAKRWLSDSELLDPIHQKNNPNHLAHASQVVWQLAQTLQNDFAKNKMAKKLYDTMDIPVASVLAAMEIEGVFIDAPTLHKQSETIAKELASLKEKIYALAGEEFKIESPKQIGQVLFEKLGLPILKKTPTGAPSTAEPVLTELAQDYEIPELILKYRGLTKLKSTYTDKLPTQINPKTGRVHTTYLQTGTSTGRLASVNPNLQNIPVRTEEGRKVRLAFVPPEGYKMLAADYSQIELRIMAHLSQDPNLLSAFANNEDVHRHTASVVLDIKPEAVTFEQRRQAKAVNFGLMYGMSAFGLAKQLGIPREEAQAFIDRYFEKYPGIKSYMDETYTKAKEQGYVETLFGRRIAVPDINSKNHMRAAGAQRAAINAPLQGTAADIMKQAMIHYDNWHKHSKSKTNMLMQVHDELVFQVPEEEVEQTSKAIKEAMESAIQLDVPLLVDVGVGDNWQEAH